MCGFAVPESVEGRDFAPVIFGSPPADRTLQMHNLSGRSEHRELNVPIRRHPNPWGDWDSTLSPG